MYCEYRRCCHLICYPKDSCFSTLSLSLYLVSLVRLPPPFVMSLFIVVWFYLFISGRGFSSTLGSLSFPTLYCSPISNASSGEHPLLILHDSGRNRFCRQRLIFSRTGFIYCAFYGASWLLILYLFTFDLRCFQLGCLWQILYWNCFPAHRPVIRLAPVIC